MSTGGAGSSDRKPAKPLDIAGPKPASSKGDLLAAAQEAAVAEAEKVRQQREAERAASAETIRRRRARITLLALVILALSAVLVVRPSWLGGRAAAAPEPAAVRDAHARGAMALTATLLQAHLRQHGALPSSLAVLGTRLPPDIRYVRVDDRRFVLEHAGARGLVLRSEDDPSAFLAGRLSVLRPPESK